MGKFFDAMQKAASKPGSKVEGNADEPRPDSAMPTHATHGRDFDFLSINPPEGKKPITKSNLEPLPVNELLVSCRENGDRDISIAAEQFKMLSSQIMFPLNRPPCRAIMVTSAIPEEGKSIVSSNLAISIARGKQEHVLLIEGDLRRPSLARLFGISNAMGLSDYLTDREELHNLLCKTQVDKLTLLPAGRPPNNPYELLSSVKMRALLEEVKNRYHDRLIILDSTPVQVAAEASMLSQFIDGVVLVVRYGKSSRKVIKETVEKVGKEMFIGVVFNSVEKQQTHSYYHYYKYYARTKS